MKYFKNSKTLLTIAGIIIVFLIIGAYVDNKKDFDTKEKELISVETPNIGEEIDSPLNVKGEARGFWFFEGDAPLIVVDWDGRIIGESYITAQGEWMTEDLVPFIGTIEFEKQESGSRGAVIFQKDNPSGLPENDDALEIPIIFK